AAGEFVCGLFYFNYPGGTGLMAGAVFGRIAGTSAGKAAVGWGAAAHPPPRPSPARGEGEEERGEPDSLLLPPPLRGRVGVGGISPLLRPARSATNPPLSASAPPSRRSRRAPPSSSCSTRRSRTTCSAPPRSPSAN